MKRDEDKGEPDSGHFPRHSSAYVRVPSANEAGCTQEARYTAADMSVLWGGGSPANREAAGVAIP